MTMKSALRTAVAAIATMLIALTLAGCVQREDAAETVSDWVVRKLCCVHPANSRNCRSR